MTGDMMIAAEAVSAITVTVIGITQIIKWAGVPVRFAPGILMILSVSAVLLYIYKPFIYAVIVAASIVMMGASGVYGFANRTPSPAPPGPVSAAPPEPETPPNPGPAPSPAQESVVIPSQASAASSEEKTA